MLTHSLATVATVLVLTFGVACASAAEGVEAKPRRSVLALRQRPYLVRVDVAFQADAELDLAFREEFCERLRAEISRLYGAQWTATVRESSALAPPNPAGLERLTDLDLLDEGDESDKRFLLLVARAGGMLEVSGREWDAASRRLSTTESVTGWERRTLPEAAMSLLGRLFHPLAAVVDVQQNEVMLQLQAGNFPAVDPGNAPLQKGDLLIAFFRYLDRQGNVRQVQTLPWTYLEVDEVERSAVRAKLATGLRSPLGTKRRMGVELLAVAVRPQFRESELTLVRRGASQRPLAGHSVVVTERNPLDIPAPGGKPPGEGGAAAADGNDDEKNVEAGNPVLRRLLTNRSGSVVVPVEEGHPLVWLSVLSGQSVLARVPYVPGVEWRGVLELPDDSLRLSVEGQLDLVKGRLIDTVAHRAVLVSRARALGRAGEWPSVDRLLVEIQEVRGVEAFTREVTAIRTLAAEEARARGDRASEARIRQLANDTTELIRRYLDADRITSLKEELRELRAAENDIQGAAKAVP